MSTMRAAGFEKQGSIKLRPVPKPRPGVGEASVRVTLTTICGTDVHILRGEYPVRPGLVIGHERVDQLEGADDSFGHQRDGVLKVALRP